MCFESGSPCPARRFQPMPPSRETHRLLPGPPLCDEAVRHGGAYLMELVATAQRGDRTHVLDRALGLAE